MKALNDSKQKLFFVLSLLIITIFVYWPWFGSLDIMSAGDWGYYYRETMRGLITTPYLIQNDVFGSSNLTLSNYPLVLLWGLVSLVGDFEIGERVLYLWIGAIMSVISSFVLTRYITKSNAAAFVGALLYGFNTYTITLIHAGHITLYVAYSLIPLAIWSLLKTIEYRTLYTAILTGVIGCVLAVYDFRYFYMYCWIALVVYIFTLINIYKQGFRKTLEITIYTAIPFVMVLVLNMYWIVGLGRSLTSNSLLDRGLFGDEYLNIIDALTLHHPFWGTDGITYFQNQPPQLWFYLIPIFAIAGLYQNRKNLAVIMFGILALVGILLTKQSDVPFEDFYQFLYDYLPGFNAFREASKFFTLIALGYSVLIASFAKFIINYKSGFEFENFGKLAVLCCMMLISLVNLYPVITPGKIDMLIPQEVPSEYLDIEDFVQSLDSSRTLWLPNSNRWSYYDSNHKAISGLDFYTNFVQKHHNFAQTSYEDFVRQIAYDPAAQRAIANSTAEYLVITPESDLIISNEELTEVIEKSDMFEKIKWGNSNVQIYKFKNPKPEFTASQKLYYIDPQNFGSAASQLSNSTNYTFKKYQNHNFSITPTLSYFDRDKYISEQNAEISLEPNWSAYISDASNNFVISTSENSIQISNSNNIVLEHDVDTNIENYRILVNKKIYNPEQTKELKNLSPNDQIQIVKVNSTNLIKNHSFEQGLWHDKVIDCNNYDDEPIIDMLLNRSNAKDGEQSLELKARKHDACSSQVIGFAPARNFIIQFDFLTPKTAGYKIVTQGASKGQQINSKSDTWQNFQTVFASESNISQAEFFLYAYASDEKTTNTVLYDNVGMYTYDTVATYQVPKPTYTESTARAISIQNPYAAINLIKNGKFDDGTWQKEVDDCNDYDDNPQISMQVLGDEKYLRLKATRHTACTGQRIDIEGGQTYLLSFDTRSPNIEHTTLSITFDNVDNSTINQKVSLAGDTWQKFSTFVTVPTDANSAYITIYALSLDEKTEVQVDYDNFELIPSPNWNSKIVIVESKDAEYKDDLQVSLKTSTPWSKTLLLQNTTEHFWLYTNLYFNPEWHLYPVSSDFEILPKPLDVEAIDTNGGFLAFELSSEDLCGAKLCESVALNLEYTPQRWTNILSAASVLIIIFLILYMCIATIWRIWKSSYVISSEFSNLLDFGDELEWFRLNSKKIKKHADTKLDHLGARIALLASCTLGTITLAVIFGWSIVSIFTILGFVWLYVLNIDHKYLFIYFVVLLMSLPFVINYSQTAASVVGVIILILFAILIFDSFAKHRIR